MVGTRSGMSRWTCAPMPRGALMTRADLVMPPAWPRERTPVRAGVRTRVWVFTVFFAARSMNVSHVFALERENLHSVRRLNCKSSIDELTRSARSGDSCSQVPSCYLKEPCQLPTPLQSLPLDPFQLRPNCSRLGLARADPRSLQGRLARSLRALNDLERRITSAFRQPSTESAHNRASTAHEGEQRCVL